MRADLGTEVAKLFFRSWCSPACLFGPRNVTSTAAQGLPRPCSSHAKGLGSDCGGGEPVGTGRTAVLGLPSACLWEPQHSASTAGQPTQGQTCGGASSTGHTLSEPVTVPVDHLPWDFITSLARSLTFVAHPL